MEVGYKLKQMEKVLNIGPIFKNQNLYKSQFIILIQVMNLVKYLLTMLERKE